MERRAFVKSTLAGALGSTALSAKDGIPRRAYRDNVQLSVIGFGAIVVMGHDQTTADRIVAESVGQGINYFDVAPSYGDGEAEIKLGPALKPHRDKVFLACKTTKRDADGARIELEQSLKRLHTDHFDLYQFHALSSLKDVDQILGAKGAAETFLKAREQGKVKYLGASAHSAEAAIAMMDRFKLDSVLFPVNYVCWEQGKFGPQILEHAKQKGVARLALKAMAYSKWPAGAQRNKEYPNCWYQPLDQAEKVRTAVRWTLSQDITAAIPPGHDRLYRLALDAVRDFKPLSAAEQRDLLAGTKGVEPLFRG
jgi:aryl-alcohol dehydrogenase-like predicted oxidoreductase